MTFPPFSPLRTASPPACRQAGPFLCQKVCSQQTGWGSVRFFTNLLTSPSHPEGETARHNEAGQDTPPSPSDRPCPQRTFHFVPEGQMRHLRGQSKLPSPQRGFGSKKIFAAVLRSSPTPSPVGRMRFTRKKVGRFLCWRYIRPASPSGCQATIVKNFPKGRQTHMGLGFPLCSTHKAGVESHGNFGGSGSPVRKTSMVEHIVAFPSLNQPLLLSFSPCILLLAPSCLVPLRWWRGAIRVSPDGSMNPLPSGESSRTPHLPVG